MVDEPALIDALQRGAIGGRRSGCVRGRAAAAGQPLLKLDNVLLAPHNANSSPSAWERVHWNTLRMLLEGLGFELTDELIALVRRPIVRSC